MKKTPVTPGTLATPATFRMGVVAVVLAAIVSYRQAGLTDVAGFLIITASALLPAALWCHRRTEGLPLYPLFALGTIVTFALPLIAHHPLVLEYTARERFSAALVLGATLLIGTVPWFWLTRAPLPAPRRSYELRPSFGLHFFLGILLVATVFNLEELALMERIEPALFSVLRAAVIALSNVAIFIVGHRSGHGRLSGLDRLLCALLSLGLIVSTLPSGLMVNALSYGLMALIGFALGRGRVPWWPLAALGGAALFLQMGKEDLRDKYWFSADAAPLGLADYPDLMADWMRFSFIEATTSPDPAQPEVESASQSLVGRASLLQLFLRIQAMSPDPVPYLHGRTYTVIPQLLVPRALDPEKKRTHLGTYLLAMDYGLQTSEDTLTTTIGFGLINEAMANFGYAGCLGLGVALGIFYGAVARWSSGCPLLSLRSLLAILVLSLSFQNEFCAGVYITTLFQGVCVLLALAPFAMRRGQAVAPGVQPALAGVTA